MLWFTFSALIHSGIGLYSLTSAWPVMLIPMRNVRYVRLTTAAVRVCRRQQMSAVVITTQLWPQLQANLRTMRLLRAVKGAAHCHNRFSIHAGYSLLRVCRAISPDSTWLVRHVSTRHDTFDVSSASRRACRAVLFDKLDTTEMRGLDTSNVSCRVETWRDEPSGIWALRNTFVLLHASMQTLRSAPHHGATLCRVKPHAVIE